MPNSSILIGSSRSRGALATCYMIVWARKFKEAIEKAMVNLTGYLLLLMKIYVDDGNMAARALPLGSRLCERGGGILGSRICGTVASSGLPFGYKFA